MSMCFDGRGGQGNGAFHPIGPTDLLSGPSGPGAMPETTTEPLHNERLGTLLAELALCRKGVQTLSGIFGPIPTQLNESGLSARDSSEALLRKTRELVQTAMGKAVRSLAKSFLDKLPPDWIDFTWAEHDWAATIASLSNKPTNQSIVRDPAIARDLIIEAATLLIGSGKSQKGNQTFAWTQERFGQVAGYSFKVPTIVHAALEMPFLGRAIFGDLWSPKCDQGAIAHEAVEAGCIFRKNGSKSRFLLTSQDAGARNEILKRFAKRYGESGFPIYLLAAGLTENDYSQDQVAMGDFKKLCIDLASNVPGLSEVRDSFFDQVVVQSEVAATTRGLKEDTILSSLSSILSGKEVNFTELNCDPEMLYETARAIPLIMIVDRICEADGMVRFQDPAYRERYFRSQPHDIDDLRVRVLLTSARLLLTFETIRELVVQASTLNFKENLAGSSALYDINELRTIAEGCEFGRAVVLNRLTKTFNPLFEETGNEPITLEDCEAVATGFIAPLRARIGELFGSEVVNSATKDMKPLTSDEAYKLLITKAA